MTNSILGSISRFWLEINANAWRYCPETVQQRLHAAYVSFSKDIREHLCEQSDADFGRGWREGHEAGRASGWAERDLDAQRELALKNDEIQALMTMVESYRMGAPEGAAPAAASEPERRPPVSLGLAAPRAPVH